MPVCRLGAIAPHDAAIHGGAPRPPAGAGGVGRSRERGVLAGRHRVTILKAERADTSRSARVEERIRRAERPSAGSGALPPPGGTQSRAQPHDRPGTSHARDSAPRASGGADLQPSVEGGAHSRAVETGARRGGRVVEIAPEGHEWARFAPSTRRGRPVEGSVTSPSSAVSQPRASSRVPPTKDVLEAPQLVRRAGRPEGQAAQHTVVPASRGSPAGVDPNRRSVSGS